MDDNKRKELTWKFWLAKDKEEFAWIIKQACYGFYALAVIQILLYFIVGPMVFLDVAILTILTTILLIIKSRIAAIFLLLFSLLSVVSTVMGMLGLIQGGRNIILAIIFAYVAVSAVYSSFGYHRTNIT